MMMTNGTKRVVGGYVGPFFKRPETQRAQRALGRWFGWGNGESSGGGEGSKGAASDMVATRYQAYLEW